MAKSIKRICSVSLIRNLHEFSSYSYTFLRDSILMDSENSFFEAANFDIETYTVVSDDSAKFYIFEDMIFNH